MSFQLGKLLVTLGIIIIVAGFLVMLGSRFSPLGLGKLPGDLAIKGKNWSFYFPIVTCLVISLVVTAIMWLIGLMTRR
jgi:ribose/xylose/arabinose/galactoside ABC-type transport system permease subunit